MAQLFTNHVQDVLECPACLETPRAPPIYQCERGHIVCNNCRPKLQNCPTCLNGKKKSKVANIVKKIRLSIFVKNVKAIHNCQNCHFFKMSNNCQTGQKH